MNNNNEITPNLILDDEKKFINLSNKFKEEYVKNLFKKFLLLSLLIVLLMSSLFFKDLFTNDQFPFMSALISSFLAVLFSYYYIFSLSYARVSLKKRFKKNPIIIINLTFYYITIILIILTIYFSSNYLIILAFSRIFIVYLLLILIIPILSGKLNDEFIVKLNPDYYIIFSLEIRLLKHKILDSHLVKIHMKSNRLFSDLDQSKLDHFREINEKRWLPRRTIEEKFMGYIKPKYYFNEYSTIINFKKQFINLVSAIREWDLYCTALGREDINKKI
ncbi:MAG: hypothetical protein EAX89_14420 [Candidatus Lokiarchaeota archaeon]|nr:hypothetical protein [Candidatus Lokiarchaeota archaeon]